MLNIFHMSVNHLYDLGGVCFDPVLIFNWDACLPGVESYEFFIYLGDETLVPCIIDKYVLPYSHVPFHLMMFSLAMQKFLI